MLVEKRNSEVHLRPRFSIAIEENSEKLLQRITNYLNKQDCIYNNKIVDGHVFLDIPESKSHFWSPQLHLEVIKNTKKTAILKGLFGPKPQVWTLFMFIHFLLITAFLGFLILLYTRITLEEDIFFPSAMLIVIPFIWVLLYFLGQVGKETGRKQMKELHEFILSIIDSH
jgi:hypothetical protein